MKPEDISATCTDSGTFQKSGRLLSACVLVRKIGKMGSDLAMATLSLSTLLDECYAGYSELVGIIASIGQRPLLISVWLVVVSFQGFVGSDRVISVFVCVVDNLGWRRGNLVSSERKAWGTCVCVCVCVCGEVGGW